MFEDCTIQWAEDYGKKVAINITYPEFSNPKDAAGVRRIRCVPCPNGVEVVGTELRPDSDNTDWMNLQKWVAAGNTIAEAD